MKSASVEQVLRDHGLRVTPQRMAVLSYIRSSSDHPTAEEIYRAVRGDHPAISLNTVYKSLEAFEREGLLTKFVIGDRSNYRYDFTTRDHIHHLCVSCGRVSDVDLTDPDCIARVLEGISHPDPGDVERVEINLIGECGECLLRERSPEG